MHIIARLFEWVLYRAWLGAMAMLVMTNVMKMITHMAAVAVCPNALNTHTSANAPEIPMLGHWCSAWKSAVFVWALMFVSGHLHLL